MGELSFPSEAPIVIYCDNQSAIHVADNPIVHNKMKQVKLHVHYIRKLVHEKVVSLLYCKTND